MADQPEVFCMRPGFVPVILQLLIIPSIIAEKKSWQEFPKTTLYQEFFKTKYMLFYQKVFPYIARRNSVDKSQQRHDFMNNHGFFIAW